MNAEPESTRRPVRYSTALLATCAFVFLGVQASRAAGPAPGQDGACSDPISLSVTTHSAVGLRGASITVDACKSTPELKPAPGVAVTPLAALGYLREAEIRLPADVSLGQGQIWTWRDSARTALGTRCTSVAADEDRRIRVNPSLLECLDGRGLTSGGALVLVLGGGQTAVFSIPDASALIPGSDYGFSLNLIDRSGDHQRFRVFDGLAAYYSVSKLKNSHTRLVTQISVLDFDPAIDFELGFAVGLIWRPGGLASETGKGFSIGIGIGQNLMVTNAKDGRYWFIGLGLNIDRTGAAR